MTSSAPAGRPAHYLPGLPAPDRCLVMGVVNVTPDSFSDGGRWFQPEDAIARGLHLARDGADLVDVGGESTRPGALRPSIDEELRRVIPVVRALSSAGVIVSIDTMRAEVAERALEAGARLVNDVSGGSADPAMFPLVAAAKVPYVLMHWRGHSIDMQDRAQYGDVVEDVATELRQRLQAADASGVDLDLVAVDPGLGFAKTVDHNWTILARLAELLTIGRPVVLGASRKTFLGVLLADPNTGQPRPADQRDDATAVLSAQAALARAWCVRVHDVASSLDAVRVAARLGAELP